MAIAFLKFEDKEDGGIEVSGGISGTLEPGSGAHMAVLRLSQQLESLGGLISSLPPVQLTDLPVPEDEPTVAPV